MNPLVIAMGYFEHASAGASLYNEQVTLGTVTIEWEEVTGNRAGYELSNPMRYGSLVLELQWTAVSAIAEVEEMQYPRVAMHRVLSGHQHEEHTMTTKSY